jgi:biopolymer transport protein ExbD/biopolymer transport protein TolR
MAFSTRDGKTQTVLAEINMIPFIDIVLVLLIIFMITAPVIQSGIQVEVPRTQTTRAMTDKLPVVTIVRNQTVYFQDDEINVHDLAPRVKAELPKFRRPSVYVRADGEVPYKTIAAVLDYLKDGGIQDVELVTQPLEGSR